MSKTKSDRRTQENEKVDELFNYLCQWAYEKSLCFSLPAYREIAKTIIKGGWKKENGD